MFVGIDVFGRGCFGGGGYNTNLVSSTSTCNNSHYCIVVNSIEYTSVLAVLHRFVRGYYHCPGLVQGVKKWLIRTLHNSANAYTVHVY